MPWSNNGTVQVSSGGTIANGTGTTFLSSARVGDALTIAGSTSLHEVTAIASDTQLTFQPPYTGTTGSGNAYRIAPIMGYDKDLSDAFNSIRLQWGTQLSSLQPWATAETADIALSNLGGSQTGTAVFKGSPAAGRTALGLGNAATATVQTSPTDTTAGALMAVGAGGWMGIAGADSYIAGFPQTAANNISQVYRRESLDNGVLSHSASIHFAAGDTWGRVRINYYTPQAWIQGGVAGNGSGWTAELYHTGNTTVDANGFVKRASPIIKLHADRIETDAVGTFERIGTGHYRITGCNGLRLTEGWYIETPHDRNGNKYFNVEWEQDTEPNADAGVLEEAANVALTIRCYERVWNPATGLHENGEPADILAGRWIDLRMNEVRQSEPEQEADV